MTTTQLIDAARRNAQAVKKINESVTVASGAVVGGPSPSPAPVSPATGGTAP